MTKGVLKSLLCIFNAPCNIFLSGRERRFTTGKIQNENIGKKAPSQQNAGFPADILKG